MSRSTLGGARGRVGPEAALAALVLTIVSLMVVPIPTGLLDLLLAANVSFAVLMLLAALFAKSGLELSAFPTILLVSTLFRLSLNVSSTRLILLDADAGQVIHAFGHFVVRGDYIVGAIVFAVLTLVQFVVIAKGSERVAEVGARFTLDAMPGKQMSIDAELRSGALTQEDAREKRRLLERESQFYGAMDGAMKFVKGDAIAGIVITLVNLGGGVAVGALSRGMDATESLRTFGLLTIGDGLVSQIPALLISTAAGFVVTRVASAEADGSLARDLRGQIFGDRRTLLAGALFLGLMAIAPGLPFLPFAVLSLSVGIAGLRTSHAPLSFSALKRAAERVRSPSADAPTDTPAEESPRVPLLVPIEVRVGAALGLALEGSPTDIVAPALRRAGERIFFELGLDLPRARVGIDPSLDEELLAVDVQETPVVRETLPIRTPEAIASAIEDAVVLAGRRRAADLLGHQEVQQMLDRLESVYPATVRSVIPKPVPLGLLTEVLRRLAEEGVNLRQLREILEALALHAPTERDPLELAELVRAALRRGLTHQHADAGILRPYLVDPEIEDAVRDHVRRTAHGAYLTLPPDLAREIAGAAAELDAGRCVLLTQPDVRRFLRRLLDATLPEVVVLSYAEIAAGVEVDPRGTLRIGGL